MSAPDVKIMAGSLYGSMKERNRLLTGVAGSVVLRLHLAPSPPPMSALLLSQKHMAPKNIRRRRK